MSVVYLDVLLLCLHVVIYTFYVVVVVSFAPDKQVQFPKLRKSL